MSLIFKKGGMKARNKDGEMIPVDFIVGDTAKNIRDIQSAGSAALTEISNAKGGAISDIESSKEGALNQIETAKQSIPAEYSALYAKVEGLKDGTKETAMWHLGFYLDENGDLCQED